MDKDTEMKDATAPAVSAVSVPAHFKCPITHEVMTDPVIAQDGHTYQREVIQGWFNAGNNTSPLTREVMGLTLLNNHTMRSELSEAGYPVKSLNARIADTGNGVKIVLVLDVSGSMDTSVECKKTNEPSFSRLDLIKHAVSSISAMMRPSDSLNIVTFSDSARVILPWTRMDPAGQARAQQMATALHTEGGTNIPAGVEEGTRQGGDHLILLTDGANTTGSCPPRMTLGEYMVSKITSYTGVIHSVGLGMAGDLDTPTLRAVSSNKKGFYCFCPDASMVGTVFIHLMANIIVNEPGVAFPQHDLFVSTLIEAARTKSPTVLQGVLNTLQDPILREDLISAEDNKGQVEKALTHWDTWGRHYLPAFIDAHIHKMTTNFKDASLQAYATPATRAFIDAGEVIFLGITPPVPSCQNTHRTAYTGYQFATAALSSQGICFGPETLFKTLTPNGPDRYMPIKDIKKGMFIGSQGKVVKVVSLVESPPTEMIKIYDFWVSRKHPLLVKKPGRVPVWAHAETFDHDQTNIRMLKCFNMVLDGGHVVEVSNSGIEAVTLGHGRTGGIVEHDYLGTNKIVNDLSKAPGWDQGFVQIKALRRNNAGVCGIEV